MWRHKKVNGDTFLAYVHLICIKESLFALLSNADEEDNMYKLLFEDNKNVNLLLDAYSGEIITANKAAVLFYGYSLQDLKNKKSHELTLISEQELQKRFNLVLENKQNYFFVKHKLANGEIRDVDITSFPITLLGKKYIWVIVCDVTDKMKQNLIIDTFITQSPYPIAVLDNEQRVLNINDKFTDLFQYQKEEISGKNLNDLLTTVEYREELNKHIEQVFTENFIRVVTMRKRKDNSLLNVEIIAFPMTYNDRIIGAYVHYIDMTQKIKVQNQLELFKKVLENSNEGIIVTDSYSHIEWVNHAFTKITGYSMDDIIGNTPRILKSGLQSKDFYHNMWQHVLQDKHWHGEIWNKNKKGDLYPEWLNIYAIKNNQITTNYVGIFKDLSEQKTIDQKMRILAQKDALTGLFNRLYFTENLNRVIQKEHRELTAVLFIDLNHFKEINDSLGHHAGDQFLIELSSRLQLYFNQRTLIARYGGDEFVILLNECLNKQQITAQARKILKIINTPYIYKGNYLHTSASLGIAMYPKDGSTSDELIQNADIAMYVAKKNLDKKIMYYSSTMRKDIEEKFNIANLLRTAIEKKLYTLLYEPIYDLKTKKIMSAEMKLKWQNNHLKSYPVNKYLQVAIQTGQINQIFDFMFDEICMKLTKFKNCNIPISINISIEQLEQTQFLPNIKEKIRKFKINPKNIEFEFTDNNFKQTSNRVTKNISDLLAMGFNFTLDNFGQENSSIAQLKHYQIRKIKLTKNIIKSKEDDSINYELVKLYRLISKELHILLTAKGINQDKQLDLINDLQLDGGQGSYFSKLVTFNQLIKLVNQK